VLPAPLLIKNRDKLKICSLQQIQVFIDLQTFNSWTSKYKQTCPYDHLPIHTENFNIPGISAWATATFRNVGV